MAFIAILIGCILGALVGINLPIISYSYSSYLAIAIIAALDSVFGGITGVLKGEFNLKVFISGFFCNAILSILLTYLGNKLDVDIYLAAIVVFVGRMFINLTIIRKYYIDKWSQKIEERKKKKKEQVMLLLNRRGYSSFVSCSSCGYVEKCPNCDISLTYHKSSNTLRCHYCGYGTKKNKICPNCKEEGMKDLGSGTEKI